MTTLRAHCLCCGGEKDQGKYLCLGCWSRLPRAEQIKLGKRRDGLAGQRLLEMNQQFSRGVPPEEIRVSA